MLVSQNVEMGRGGVREIKKLATSSAMCLRDSKLLFRERLGEYNLI